MNLDDIAKTLLDIQTRLTRMETLLETSVEQGRDHESRLRSLERGRYIALGAAAALGGASGKIFQIIGS